MPKFGKARGWAAKFMSKSPFKQAVPPVREPKAKATLEFDPEKKPDPYSTKLSSGKVIPSTEG